jgi:hypothetical protein
MNVESLAESEKAAAEALDIELERHSRLNMFAFNLICFALSRLPGKAFEETPLPQRIATSLLVQLSDDLRASSLLASMGYSVQAATIVSSMYELAYSIAAIGSDHTIAKKWVNHDDPTRPFLSVKKLTIEGLRKLEHSDLEVQANSEYRVYQQLCMAKHKNPLFHKQHGYTIQGSKVIIMNGPKTSEESIRTAWFTMEHASGLAFIALLSFIKNHLSLIENNDLIQNVWKLGKQKKQLETEAINRWGTEDPFPGKW